MHDSIGLLRRTGLPVSAALHALALVGLGVFAPPLPLPDAVQQVITVELVSPPAAVLPQSDASLPVLAAETGAAAAPETAQTEMITANEMLAGAALADPRNAEARAMLEVVETFTRREQVCGIEAMEQIRAGAPNGQPECVISYAFEPTRTEGETVTAMGAAVLVGTVWYRLAYDCTLNPDRASVASFSYRVGDAIQVAEADRLGLATCK